MGLGFRYRLLGIAVVTLTLFAFQNCGESFKSIEQANFSSKGDPNDPPAKPDVPEIKDWNDPFPAGVVDSDCMSSSKYNVCLIYKDPVSANGAAFDPKLTPKTSNEAIEASIMTYGLKVPEAGPLANNHYVIKDGVKADASTNAGSWKFPYEGDDNHFVAQVTAFYWLNRQLTFMQEVAGGFYFKDKKAPVKAYASDVQNNAYFDGDGITLGYIKFSGDSSRGDAGLDAGVLAHEAGHGNLFVASRGAGIQRNCRNKNGCFGGIHEGQGDVHTFILFPENSTLGSYFMNRTGGLRSPASIKDSGVTAQDLFDKRSGEVHDMGEVYASLWWEVWEKAKGEGREHELEKIFTDHLAGLGASDNFTTALEVIEAMAQQSAPANAAKIASDFRAEYNRMQVDLP